jgi:nucleoside-diphosphate-sugar epimerase
VHVLVTGAGGFVGSAVVSRLAGEHRVRALDVAPVAAPPGGDAITGDLADWAVARRAVAGIDAVVHLATGGARPGTTPPGIVADSVGATVALFEALRDETCRRFVLMSSLAVVTGYPRGTRIGPATPPRFAGVYPLTKHLQEEVARHYAGELGAVVPILRPWVVVDADRRALRDGTPLAAESEPLAHNGAWGWIERRDLADACALALTAPLAGAPVIGLMATSLGRALIDPAAADALGWRPRFDFGADIPPGTRVPDPPPTPEALP